MNERLTTVSTYIGQRSMIECIVCKRVGVIVLVLIAICYEYKKTKNKSSVSKIKFEKTRMRIYMDMYEVYFKLYFTFFFRLVMFLGVLLLTIILPIFSVEILKYAVEEKSPRNTFVADLSKELNIKSNGFYRIYELLPLNKDLFSIDNQTGHLIIASILDREQMCLEQQCSCNSCEIVLQLFVKIKNKIIYKIIEIKIKDRNDHSPVFDRQTTIHIIHIKENVPLGYRIVLPSANDPDEGMLLTLFIYMYISVYKK